ncbi:uncharacterized protein TNCV_114001 [Trichonephila clavipes]|nr:uncharacterized protein TNCV_114001 [Trichonephila clavipes]
MMRFSPPKEESCRGARVQSDRARETRTIGSKGHRAAEGRPVRSGKTATVRPCPYYLRSRFKEPEGLPEEQRITGIDSLPQNSLRRRSLSMEALDGDPDDRSILKTKKKFRFYGHFFVFLLTSSQAILDLRINPIFFLRGCDESLRHFSTNTLRRLWGWKIRVYFQSALKGENGICKSDRVFKESVVS